MDMEARYREPMGRDLLGSGFGSAGTRPSYRLFDRLARAPSHTSRLRSCWCRVVEGEGLEDKCLAVRSHAHAPMQPGATRVALQTGATLHSANFLDRVNGAIDVTRKHRALCRFIRVLSRDALIATSACRPDSLGESEPLAHSVRAFSSVDSTLAPCLGIEGHQLALLDCRGAVNLAVR